MKILYKNFPFKTNRNVIAKLGAGINAPNNLNNKLKKVQTTTLNLPSVVYHMSTSPIKEFTPNRIFYVSFSKEQAFLHLSQYIEQIQKKINNKDDTKIYVYTLKPRVRSIRAIVFDKTHRPKTISNSIGLKYNVPGRKMMMFGVAGNINSQNFREGSGDNMILGHLLCSKTGVNGIRNTENQDELAICNPRNFFRVFDREVLDIGLRTINAKGQLPFYNASHLSQKIEFKNMRYVSKGSVMNLLHKYGTSKIQEMRSKQALRKLL